MTYTDAMAELNDAIYAAVRAADDEDGAPVEALRKIAADIDSLIDHRCTADNQPASFVDVTADADDLIRSRLERLDYSEGEISEMMGAA